MKVHLLPLSTLLLSLLLSGPIVGQSGRRQEPGKTPKPTPGPHLDPSRPSGSTKVATKSTDEIDPGDVVRISSNLVPIPVSVVDSRGNALVSLKLDDFELRVDGQLRPLSDLSR